MYDLIIKGAAVLDGTGADAYFKDIAIKDGKIEKIGENLSGADEIIDAGGLTVSPGFIDSHSHSDRSFLTYPEMKEKVEQGITFSIAGQCGSSPAPVVNEDGLLKMSEYLENAEKVMQGAGAACLVGFNTVRRAVIGSENRDPSPEELEKMCDLVRDAIRGGAIGMSYGVFYVPACYAKTEELVALAKVVAEEGGVIAAHIRNESNILVESVAEYIHIVKESGCKAILSHHKACEKENWGKVKTTIEMIDKANAEGADIYFDVYPYIATSTTMISRFCPVQFHPPGTKSAVELLYNPEICKAIKEWGDAKWHNDISWTFVTSCAGHPEYAGKTVSEIAKMLGREDDELEVALDIVRVSNGKAQACFFTIGEQDMKFVMSHPRAMIGTDAGVAGKSTVYHPRLRGTFPRALGKYARDEGVVSIPEMVRKMTSLTAEAWGIKGKGKIEVGMDADLCIFDADKIIDRSDFLHCTEKNEGIAYVIVGGKIALKDNEANGVCAGKIYRR